jgi:hypothetical protein
MGHSSSIDEELEEGVDYSASKRRMKGNEPDSRFDEGSTDSSPKVVRPEVGSYGKGKFFDYLKKRSR